MSEIKKRSGRPPIGSRPLTVDMVRNFSHLVDENSRMIALTQEKVTIVDAVDYERLNQYAWYAAETRKGSGLFYAQKIFIVNGVHYTVQMQRMVLDPNLNVTVPAVGIADHKDHDTLNNRRSNLRQVDAVGSTQNRRRQKSNRGKYKGVHYRGERPRGKNWRARISANGKEYNLGDFYTEEDAARAHDEAASRLHKEFACLNFPREQATARPILAPA